MYWRAKTIRAALTICLALGSVTVAHAEYPRLSRSLFWQPYAHDGVTVALFHLDEQGVAPAGDLEVENLDKAPVLDELEAVPAPGASGSGRTARNSSPMGISAGLKGSARFIAGGLFSGGVSLGGGDGALMIDRCAAGTGSKTLEFWLRLEEYPAAESVLIYQAAAPPRPPSAHQAAEHNARLGPARLLLQSDGSLALEWFGKRQPVPEIKLPRERWTHFAMAISSEWPTANTVRLFLNGRESAVLPVDTFQAGNLARESAQVWIGNDASAQKGVRAAVDEVRISKVVRAFYESDLDWPQPAREVNAAPGQPFFRDAADLLFELDFNGRTQPARSAPQTRFPEETVTAADLELNPAKVAARFPMSVNGRGLMLGEGSLSPVYEGRGNLLPARGTIAFWLQPVDWDNYTRDNRFDGVNPTVFGLFQVDGEYAEGSYDRKFSPRGPLLEFNVVLHMDESVENPVNLAPGRWHHLAMTWEGVHWRFYVDGKPREPGGAWNVWLPIYPGHDPRNQPEPEWWLKARPEAIRFGTRRYWDQTALAAPRSVIDDFRVYRRPLAPSEIANLAWLYDPRQELQPLPAIDMAMHWNGVSGRVTTDLIPLVKNFSEAASAIVQVIKQAANEPVGRAEAVFDERKEARIEVQTPPLEFAAYRVTADVQDAGGKSLAAVEQSFSRPPPPWWECRAGLSDRVMREWTPVTMKDNVVSVWGRQIHFAPSGLPEKIISQGEDILAGPITLTIKDVTLQAGTGKVTSAEETRAEVHGSLESDQLTVSADSYIEFDGMMWFTVTLTPRSPLAPRSSLLDRLTLRVPFRRDNAEYVHWWSGAANFRDPKSVQIGALAEQPRVVFRSNDPDTLHLPPTLRGSFIPYVLLSGMQRGLAWFAENDRGWTQSSDTPAVSIERDRDTVTLVLNVISSEVKLEGPRTFEFGLQPIPVKPIDKLWRQFPKYSNVFPDTFCGNNLKGRKGPSAFYLYPEDDWEAVQRRIEGEGLTKGAAGLKGLYRGQLDQLKRAGITDPPPQSLTVPGLYWDLQWNGIPPMEHTREWAETWARDYQTYTPAFIDFAAWAWRDWLEKTGQFVRGAYIDDCWPAPQSTEHGLNTYRLPDGHIQPGYQFRAYRERLKRMRQISWDLGVWPHLTAHTTHTFFIPYHSFFDLILDGEDYYSAPPSQGDFIDHWPLDRMRFMHNAKWGLVTTWLGWCGNSLQTDRWPAWTFRQERAYIANLALHDIWWGFDETVMREFGLRQPETEFFPYWQNRGLVRENAQPEVIKVGAWKRAGRWLVLVVNVGPERAEAKLRLDLPGNAAVRDVDPTLLSYFKEDATTVGKPEVKETEVKEQADVLADEFSLEEREEDLPLEERRARDPDGKFAWQDGVLTCPVRRHDYRLFLMSRP